MTRGQPSTTRKANPRRVVRFMSVLIVAICFPVLPTVGQQTMLNSAKSALTELAAELRPRYGPVRFHREEGLEDRFVVRPTVEAIATGVPRIYLVEGKPFDISSGSVVAQFGAGPPIMYVGVSRDGTTLYKLAGFDRAEQDFSRLVQSIPQQTMRGKDQAESRGRLCAEIVYGLSSKWIAEGASNVKLSAANHFFDEGHSDGLELAEKWWRKAKGDRASLQVTTETGADGFLVKIPVFWSSVEGHLSPEVRLYQINVARDGSCHLDTPPSVVLR